MKKTELVLALATTCLFFAGAVEGVQEHQGTRESVNNGTTAIRVLLERGSQSVKVRSLGEHCFVQLEPKGPWHQTDREIVISISHKSDSPQLQLGAMTLRSKTITVRGGISPTEKFLYGANTYRGALRVELIRDRLRSVNFVPLEEYIVGILPREMAPDWELEALKAQAVASRTYALFMKKHPKDRSYDLQTTFHDQVYGGADLETARVREAVRSTEGQFLSKKHRPVKAYFHSRCGGETENPAIVWNRAAGSMARVRCPFCRKSKWDWTTQISLNDVKRALGVPKESGLALSIGNRTPSGRIASLQIHGDSESKTVTSDEFRGLVGYDRIKSALFDWFQDGAALHFRGKGYGHGVGMCQWGARHLAKEGSDYRAILQHYYPGHELSLLGNQPRT